MKMKDIKSSIVRKALVTAGLAGILVIAGCNSGPKYADSVGAVNNSLTANNLGAIHVSQDRDKGVMTLTGTVPNDDQKTQAESLAKQAAPTYTIADQIAVVPPANADSMKAANTDTDNAIEDSFKAEMKKNRALAKQDISIKSTNGSVTLTGTVRTEAEKRDAERMAKKVPNVQQVVNEIEVKRHK